MSYDIDIRQVTVKYGAFEALTDISLHLACGKIYGLIGRNGAGKTTLLSLLASFMEQTEGSIEIGGKQPFENAEVMSQVCLVYETDYSEETEKVKGMLDAAERYRENFDRKYAEELVEEFKLPLDKKVREFSKGMQSALNVTIGLASRSPITIFDEAYLGMDAPTREKFYQTVLEDHAAHPRTIILSTHLVSEMEYLFEEVVILDQGKVLLHEPIDELVERGASVTGVASDVDEFVSGMKQLNTKQLGGTKSVMVYGGITEAQRKAAAHLGLEVGPVSLQELFIHLTEEEMEE
ncbi:ABC-2 type transport system ATP-binding protein [Evansella caseinilytica]|uniref:ABC-2 type transport system ATP-binding protein n=1 Tax=Evansella caseinilytica TaxID=1503961 RepID=A0A1H3UGM9_9BACI|nr:ABC transporter ATP-binding protein [Evansella caseinilytica]SDZ61620.1 ABC-2 type transport system ATP-binding protein [Evansella caseinilytica]